MMKHRLLVIALMVVCFGSELFASDQTFESAEMAANGGSPSLTDPTSSALLTIPGLVAPEMHSAFEMSWERQYQLKEFDRIAIAGSLQSSLGFISIGFDQFGLTDLFSEKTGRLVISSSFGNFGGGVLLEGSQVSFKSDYKSLTKVSLGCGVSTTVSHFTFALAGFDLNSPTYDANSVASKPSSRLYVEYSNASHASASANVTVLEGSKPQFGIGQRLGLSTGANLLIGAETEPTAYNAGLIISQGSSRFSYAASYNADLGLSHLMTIGFEWGD